MSECLTFEEVAERLIALQPDGRFFVAIAGAPGSGKSTLADKLAQRLGRRAAVLPMDGFHFDDMLLDERGWRARKGAPHTFDVGGLAQMISRLRRNDEAEIAVPVFDREIEIARAGARMIPQSIEIILVEGNYVLLKDPPWSQLTFDLSIMIDVSERELQRRLQARWEGFQMSDADIRKKLEENDLPNGRLVRTASREADIILTSPDTQRG